MRYAQRHRESGGACGGWNSEARTKKNRKTTTTTKVSRKKTQTKEMKSSSKWNKLLEFYLSIWPTCSMCSFASFSSSPPFTDGPNISHFQSACCNQTPCLFCSNHLPLPISPSFPCPLPFVRFHSDEQHFYSNSFIQIHIHTHILTVLNEQELFTIHKRNQRTCKYLA